MPTRRKSRAPHIRKDGKVTRHEELIRSLIDGDPDVHRNGFADAVKRLMAEIGQNPDEIPLGEFLPDAYKIDYEREKIICYEVEVSHALPVYKQETYGLFFMAWDSEDSHDWLPELMIVDRYGNRNELSLASLYLERVLGRHFCAA